MRWTVAEVDEDARGAAPEIDLGDGPFPAAMIAYPVADVWHPRSNAAAPFGTVHADGSARGVVVDLVAAVQGDLHAIDEETSTVRGLARELLEYLWISHPQNLSIVRR